MSSLTRCIRWQYQHIAVIISRPVIYTTTSPPLAPADCEVRWVGQLMKHPTDDVKPSQRDSLRHRCFRRLVSVLGELVLVSSPERALGSPTGQPFYTSSHPFPPRSRAGVHVGRPCLSCITFFSMTARKKESEKGGATLNAFRTIEWLWLIVPRVLFCTWRSSWCILFPFPHHPQILPLSAHKWATESHQMQQIAVASVGGR
ncbi:hypothetical protein QBC37DRAFT_54934 [Rhypophila decipiens]|uniref:Uncharacterized protein n=1 Tax=Rhypophila decipiens TaxID=261697 RepID=A0AAN6Y3B0_9PEZI|nr:hypothetical protein QBC37DRAFT_54934 [Rhypophila decipiens]